LPQEPQSSASDSIDAHVDPHAVVPPAQPHEDEAQIWVAEQALPQEPQWRGSAAVSTQDPPQATNGAVQTPTHLPAWQSAVSPPHLAPHAPQSSGSLPSWLHFPSQDVWPWTQVHIPATQLLPVGHASPHLPQFIASVDSSTQSEPHWLRPTAQAASHAPFEQTSPIAQAWPQDPQLVASVAVSVQVPPHVASVPGHVAVIGGSPHSPLMHW
jgi:hypothetical protein